MSLPEPLLRRFRVYASERNQSMTSLMEDAIRNLVEENRPATRAKQRFLERIRSAPDRGTGGLIRWTRDELYER